jgi:hypothetical protein
VGYLYPPSRDGRADRDVGCSPRRRRNTGCAAAEPAEDAVTWPMTYRDEQDGEPITEFTSPNRCYVLTPVHLAAELTGHGLQQDRGR